MALGTRAHGPRIVRVGRGGRNPIFSFYSSKMGASAGPQRERAGKRLRGHRDIRRRIQGTMPRQGAGSRAVQCGDVRVASRESGSIALPTHPASRARAGHGLGREQRVIEAAEAEADDQQHVHAEQRGKIGEAAPGIERHEKSPAPSASTTSASARSTACAAAMRAVSISIPASAAARCGAIAGSNRKGFTIA